MRRWAVLLAVLGVIAGALWVRGERKQREQARRDAYSAVSVRGSRRVLAGVSARSEVKVRALSPRRIGADTASPEYHRYMNRCRTCHAAPDPQLYDRRGWRMVVQRMHANMRAAGTLGLRGDDEEAVLRFLDRHAKDVR